MVWLQSAIQLFQAEIFQLAVHDKINIVNLHLFDKYYIVKYRVLD